MHNVVKPPMHNQMQKPQTLNSINKGIWNAKGKGLISISVDNTCVKLKKIQHIKTWLKQENETFDF
jgi:hypothetical protein